MILYLSSDMWNFRWSFASYIYLTRVKVFWDVMLCVSSWMFHSLWLLEKLWLMQCFPSVWLEPFTQQHSITSQKTWILNHAISRNSNLMIYLMRLVRRGYCYQHSDRFICNAIWNGTEVTVGVLMSHTDSLYLDMGTEDLGLEVSGSSPGFL